MSGLLLLAAAAAALSSSPSGAAPAPLLPVMSARGEAQAVLDQQRSMPPRTGPDAGLTAQEASAIMARYLASIGKRVQGAERTEDRNR